MKLEQSEAERKKAEREAEEAVGHALKEKEEKEKAEKERDKNKNLLDELKQQVNTFQNSSGEGTSKMSEEIERLKKDLAALNKQLKEKESGNSEQAEKTTKEREERLRKALQTLHEQLIGNDSSDDENDDKQFKDAKDPQDRTDPTPPPKPPRVQTTENVVQLKLDTTLLPYFAGDRTEWISFRDFFEYLVDRNDKLSSTLKFHLLRTHLKGIALDTIKGYQMIGQNYTLAWADLKNRYDRKEDLVQEYIRRFLEVAAITQRPTFAKLRAIIDTANQMRRALPAFNISVITWDPWINFIVLTKLDEGTRQKWRQHVGRREFSTVTELLEFLETRAIELQPSQGERLCEMLKGNACHRPPKRIFQINEQQQSNKPQSDKENKKLECPICKGPHRIWHCKKLLAECARARTEIVKTLKVCFKCLLKHQLGMCENEECNYCGGPHHILPCYKKENSLKNKQKANQNKDFRPRQNYHRPKQSETKTTSPLKPEDDWDD